MTYDCIDHDGYGNLDDMTKFVQSQELGLVLKLF